MKTILKVETKYNENLADAQVLVVTLLSNTNRTWDFIVDTDAYNSLIINDYYYVTTQENWIGIIVGIRLETIAKAMHLKATVLESVRDPHDDDQVEVLDETEDDTENVDFPLTPTPWMVWADLKHIDKQVMQQKIAELESKLAASQETNDELREAIDAATATRVISNKAVKETE